MGLTVTLCDEEGDVIEVEIPTCKGVCPECKGHGKHIHPAFREQAFTQEDADREGLDFHQEVEAMQAGRYDVVCTLCKGANVVDVPDFSRMSPEEVKAWEDHEREEREYRSVCRMERMMGC